MIIKNTMCIIDDMLNFGIYKDNLEILINNCKKIRSSILIKHNISQHQYFYNLLSDLKEQYINLIEDDLYVTENIINIKKFLLKCN